VRGRPRCTLLPYTTLFRSPVSKAIAAGLKPNGVEAEAFTALAGRGVQGKVGAVTYVLGNHRLIEERGQCSPALEERLKQHEDSRSEEHTSELQSRENIVCR